MPKKRVSRKQRSSLNVDQQDLIVSCDGDHDTEDLRDVLSNGGSVNTADELGVSVSDVYPGQKPHRRNVKFDLTSSCDGSDDCRSFNRDKYDSVEIGKCGDGALPEPVASSHLLSQKFESLDYDECENTFFLDEQKKYGYKLVFHKDILRWFVVFLIAIFTALTACFIVVVVDILSKYKYRTLKRWMDQCFAENCLYQPLLFWILTNSGPVMIGSVVVTYWAPVAVGSGIPLIKCYLNGVKVPEVVRVKTFLAKAFGVICSVVGGLACGKEGPMIHCGAVIAAGISQGKSTTLKKDFKIFGSFREDREKRDFVSAGAAAGVSAAFGAPIGGVLFSLEEGASFWNQSLTWKIFFCSMISTFTLNLVMSWYHQHPGQMSYPGLINFGQFGDISYSFFELPLYILMGAMGGLFGALYNKINHKLAVFRMSYLSSNWSKVVESGLVAMATAAVGFILILCSRDCRQNILEPNATSIQFHCPDGHHSVMAELWLDTPEATVRSLFHNAPDTWTATTLSIFFVLYFLIACWTYGLSISGGLFIPALLCGAAGGRIIAIGAYSIWPDDDQSWICPGKFALIGAAAMLGGIVRMTISLTVILIEATGTMTLGLPIMIALLMAKWVGDFFTEGLYDIHIRLFSVPMLDWEPPPLSSNIYASEVMSAPVVAFKTTERVGTIVDALLKTSHNGFPVVDIDDHMSDSFLLSEHKRSYGRNRGFILRWQLIVLLQEKIFNEGSETTWDTLSLKTFRSAYPRYPAIETVEITDTEREYTMDLRPVMNPSGYTVTNAASLPRIFRLFRALGLRHLVVTNDCNEVIGIVTRKDLARYKMNYHRGNMAMERLEFSHS